MAGPPALAGPLPPDVSRADDLVVVAAVTTSFAITLTVVRFYVRFRMVKLLGWDDYTNILSTAFSTTVFGLIVAATKWGLGRHVEYVGFERATYALMLLRIAQFIIILSTITFKLSVGIFLARFFTRARMWKLVIWTVVGLNTVMSLIEVVMVFAQCRPVQLLWDKSIDGKCLPWSVNFGIVVAQGVMAALTDFILAGLPVIFLWDIKIHIGKKIAICFVMSLGLVSGLAAIIRTSLVNVLKDPSDPTWDVVPTFVWALVEANFGILAAALPSLAPILNAVDVIWKQRMSKLSDLSKSRGSEKRKSQLSSLGRKHDSCNETKSGLAIGGREAGPQYGVSPILQPLRDEDSPRSQSIELVSVSSIKQ